MPSTFEKETHIEPAGDPGSYQVVLDPSWWVWDGPNGGYVAAAMHRALETELPAAGPLRDLSVSFLEAADAGPATIEVAPVREGGSVTVARVDLRQDERPIATMRATLGAVREGSPAFVVEAVPEVPPWAHAVDFAKARGNVEPPTFTQHCDYRLAGGATPFSGEVGGTFQVWMRMAEPTPMTPPLVTFLSDAWMAAIYTSLEAPLATPSLDLSLQVHGIPEDHGDDEPLLGVFRAEHAADGYAFEDGELWTPGGELVARARQTRAVLG